MYLRFMFLICYFILSTFSLFTADCLPLCLATKSSDPHVYLDCCVVTLRNAYITFFLGGGGAIFFSAATFYRKNIWTERCNK